MHLTLKKETTRTAGANIFQQQATFDAFIEEFNNERPHAALEMKFPVEVYTPSTRVYEGLPEPNYGAALQAEKQVLYNFHTLLHAVV